MDIPYKLVAAVNTDQRHAYMAIALEQAARHGFKMIKPVPIEDGRSISIVGYGPSLSDTWQYITHPMITVSGALHFLNERGVLTDYHVDVDPRQHKINHITPPVDGVNYIMATCCHPDTWEVLKDQDVTLIHAYSSDETKLWVAQNDPDGVLIQPGSNAGMAALHIGGLLGYRHFELHGFDGCIRDGKRHAGPHYGHPQGGITWDAGCVTYQTSKIMANACAEIINSFRIYPIFGVFHGKGLQQELISEANLDNAALAGTEKAERVRNYKVIFYEQAA